MNIITVLVIGMIVYVVLDIQRQNKKVYPPGLFAQPYDASQKWKSVEVFHIDYKKDSMIQHLFMFLSLTRFYLFYMVISYMYSYPLVQTSVIVCFGIGMIAYTLAVKPFVSRLEFYRSIINELLLLAINSLILTLAVLDYKKMDEHTKRVLLGLVVIILNIAICVINNIFQIVHLYYQVKKMIQAREQKRRGGIVGSIMPGSIIPLNSFSLGEMNLEVSASDKVDDLATTSKNRRLIRDNQHNIPQEMHGLEDSPQSGAEARFSVLSSSNMNFLMSTRRSRAGSTRSRNNKSIFFSGTPSPSLIHLQYPIPVKNQRNLQLIQNVVNKRKIDLE